MSPSLAPPTPPIPRRRWLQFSLRTLLLVITAASGWLAWGAYRAQQQAIAVAALRELRGHATSKVRNPDWLWRLFGERLGRTMVRVELDSDQVAAAIPHLKAFPDLEEVQIASWPQESQQGDDAEMLLHQHQPVVKTQQVFHMLGYVTVKETVQAPDGGPVLLEAVTALKERPIPEAVSDRPGNMEARRRQALRCGNAEESVGRGSTPGAATGTRAAISGP